MFEKKFDILSCTIEQDQVAVAQQWVKTFIYNPKNDIAVNMTQLLLSCLASGDFKVRPYLSKSSELQAPSDQLTIADYLSHASRITLDYKGLTLANREELLNYFPPDGKNVFSRSATHNVRRGKDDKVVEGKGFLLGLMGQLPGLIKTPQDFGINIAMGGEGQDNFYGKKISANGYSGHFYFHRNDSDCLLMLGLEQTAPAASALEFLMGTKKYPDNVQQDHDQFGQGHSLKGASDTYTAAGSLYFSDPIYQSKLMYEKKVFPPDKYGAMQVTITDKNWPEIKKTLDKLRLLADEDHKENLLAFLLTKPESAVAIENSSLSYIALDFDSYLKRIYQVFIIECQLDLESQLILSNLQANLLVTIKNLQQGHIESYETLKHQISEIIQLKNIPLPYQKAIDRIQKLFELQLKIDPKLNQTHQELLLKNQYDDLQEESKVVLEKLLIIQKHFQKQPITQEQEALQFFLQQIEKQIKTLENPFPSSLEAMSDLSTSWVLCDEPVSISMDSIDKLRKIIDKAKVLIQPITLTPEEEISFPQLISGIQQNLLPHAQINLIDYTRLDLNNLAKQFNQYVDFLAQNAETLNLWEHASSQTANIFVDYWNKNAELSLGHAFVPQYRESTILRRLFTLDLKDLGSLRFKPYEDPAQLYETSHPSSYWSKVSRLLTAGSDVIAMLRTLKKQQTNKASWDDMRDTVDMFQEAVERFKEANELIAKKHLGAIEKPSDEVFESPFFYFISDEALHQMNGVQLVTLCLEELHAEMPSVLVQRVTNNQELWQRMDKALQTEEADFKKRKDNVEQKIIKLRTIHYFGEQVRQFKEHADLISKEKFFTELQKLSQEFSFIFEASKAVENAQVELANLREFLELLHNFSKEEDKNAALKLLKQKYQMLPEKEQEYYAAQLSECTALAFKTYLERINSAQTITERGRNFAFLNQLIGELPAEPFQVEHKIKQTEDSLYRLYSKLRRATSVKEKKLIFDNPLFSSIIMNFEQLNPAVTAECAKKIHKQLTMIKIIYEKLLEAKVISLESSNKSLDLLLKQLGPILDGIKEPLQSQLMNAVLQDKIFKIAILRQGKYKKITSVLLQDLLTLKEFRDQKIALSKEKEYENEYDQSIDRFYKKALDIRLSELPIKKQADDIMIAAHTEFKPRHDAPRLIADIAMILSFTLFGLGVFIGLGRLAAGNPFFFSRFLNEVKTDREVDLKDHWFAKKLSEEEGETRLLNAPAA
ncbi:LepB GTPase-activating domain-containing protein [Legionella sp. WA2022007384]